MFFRGSRYEPVAETVLDAPGGRTIRYKRVRFIPASQGTFVHRVAPAERLDLIAWQVYKNPELFWRICDANLALLPADLVAETGTLLVIPVPAV